MEANGDNSNSSSNPDNEWKPPTEAEKKVLLAKRERSDKISKRMAEYLLKGKNYLGFQCNLLVIPSTFNFFFCVAEKICATIMFYYNRIQDVGHHMQGL